MNNLLRSRIWPSFSPSCRLYEPEAWRPRVFLRLRSPRQARGRQDKLTLRRTVQVRLGFDLGFRISDLGFLTTITDIELSSSDFSIRSLVLTSFSVNFQSAIRIPYSAIVDPVARPSSSRSLRSAQSRTAPQAVSRTSGFPVSRSRDSNS
jgi:hypothetical protein